MLGRPPAEDIPNAWRLAAAIWASCPVACLPAPALMWIWRAE